jgi:hypothetical protein
LSSDQAPSSSIYLVKISLFLFVNSIKTFNRDLGSRHHRKVRLFHHLCHP